MRNLLTVNVGSSSVRLDAFELAEPAPVHLRRRKDDRDEADPRRALVEFAAEAGVHAVAVAHRIVHGGRTLTKTQVVGGAEEAEIDRLGELAPLHNPPALRWLRASREAFGAGVPQVAVFDTAFFADLPAVASRYALPPQLAEANDIQRYGFHGLAHALMWRRWTQVGGAPLSRAITLQLGGGCSITATADGRPLDTSMGFSPP